MEIAYSKKAIKHIQQMDSNVKKRIKNAIYKLPLGDIKKLKGFTNIYRIRVGDYRILYELEDETITILDVLPRGAAYKDL